MSKKLRKKIDRKGRKVQNDHQPGSETDQQRTVGTAKKRRLWLLLCLLAVIIGGIWYSGLAALAPQQLVREHTARSRLDDAEYWLKWAEILSFRNSENALLSARLARYRGDAELLKDQLSEARMRGADLERVQLENTLAMAQVGALAKVETDIGTWLQRPDSELDEICNAYANGLAASGRFEEAFKVLYAWRNDFPDDPRCDYRIGRLQEHQESYEEAQKSYRKAIAIDPEFFPARFSLGRALLHQRQAEKALEQFQYCFQMDQPEAAMVEAAVALKALGRSDEARPLLKRVLDQPRETIAAAYQAVEEQPEGFRPAAEYGRLESDAGNFQEALPWLQAALEENPLDLTVRYSLGVTLRGLGRMDDAELEFQKVQDARQRMSPATALNERIKRDPLDLDARLQLGKLVLENESERIGLYWIRSTLTFNPDYQPAHKMLAKYYAKKVSEDARYKALVEYHQSKISDVPLPNAESEIDQP